MNQTSFPDITILYVEDDANAREEVVFLLQRRRFNLLVAENGRQGIDLFCQKKVDIIISDIMMPRVNGLEMIRAIKKLSPTVPTILLTAYFDTKFMQEAIALGVDHYVQKPVEISQLIDALSKCCTAVHEHRLVESCQADKEKLITKLQEALQQVKKLSQEINQSIDFENKLETNSESSRHLDPDSVQKLGGNKDLCSPQKPAPENLPNLTSTALSSHPSSSLRSIFLYLDLLRQRCQDQKNLEYIDLIREHLKSTKIISENTLSEATPPLTKREIMVADLIKNGRSTNEIAEVLGIMPNSVESYRNRIRKKLGLNNISIGLKQYLESRF